MSVRSTECPLTIFVGNGLGWVEEPPCALFFLVSTGRRAFVRWLFWMLMMIRKRVKAKYVPCDIEKKKI
jgi:hypothetical protein